MPNSSFDFAFFLSLYHPGWERRGTSTRRLGDAFASILKVYDSAVDLELARPPLLQKNNSVLVNTSQVKRSAVHDSKQQGAKSRQARRQNEKRKRKRKKLTHIHPRGRLEALSGGVLTAPCSPSRRRPRFLPEVRETRQLLLLLRVHLFLL